MTMNSQFTSIQDTVVKKQDYAELRQSCTDACEVLDRSLEGRGLEGLSGSVLGEIEQLST